MRLLCLIAVALAASGPSSAANPTTASGVVAAGRAANCPIDEDEPSAVALGKVPGQSGPTLFALASLSGGADADVLGELCVSLVREQGDRFVKVAGLAGKPLTPPSDVEPVTNFYVTIPTTPFRFRPGEVAFGVEASGEYNSISNNLSFTTTYLFRRVGRGLMPIFHAKTQHDLIDKTARGDASRSTRWIIRFATTRHRGAYDLILQRVRGREARRFEWDGVRYVPAARPAG